MAEKPSKESLELIAKGIVKSANQEICRANAPSFTAWPPFHDEVYVRIIAAELREQNAALVSALQTIRDIAAAAFTSYMRAEAEAKEKP